MSSPKIVLITGATAGIGRTTAVHLARRGHHVIATGRKPAELASLVLEARGLPGKLDTLPLDVTRADSIAAAFAAIDTLTDGAGPDVVVNNAGFGVLGPTSELTDADIRRQYETNVFGALAVTRAALPAMRARGAGRIINISSVGGRLTLPYFGVYNSTKYALESLSDALRYELQPFGIDVVLVEPGVIRTNFEATAAADLARFSATPYAGALARYGEISKLADRFAAEPIVIAKAIARAVEARRPAARYVAPKRTLGFLWLRAALPQRLWDWAMRHAGFLTARNLDLVPHAAGSLASVGGRRAGAGAP